MKKPLKQITKIIVTVDKLSALCITIKGGTLAFSIELKDRPEIKTIVDDFANRLMTELDKEIE